MATGLLHGLAIATLMVIFCAACTDQPKPARLVKTQSEIKQLTNVTDSVVGLQHILPGDGEASRFQAAVHQVVAALDAASTQFDHHSDAILNITNAEALVCVKTHASMILDLEAMMERANEAALAERKAQLMLLAQDATRCAVQVAGFSQARRYG